MAQFTEEQIEAVWQKAFIQPNNDPNVFRKDYAGAWIRRDQYGDRTAVYGWEIDHCKPVSKGGTDEIDNLYPLHWENNAQKADDYPKWQLKLTSDGNHNIESVTSWHVKK